MAVTRLNLTSGDTPFDPSLPSTFPAGFSVFEDSVVQEFSTMQSQINAAFPSYAGITIVELSTGVWSADPPARTEGVNPCEFIGWSDPSSGTNGVDTPGNINDTDVWTVVAAP